MGIVTLTQMQGGMEMMGGGMMEGMGIMMLFMALFWLVILGGAVFLLWLFYRIAKGKGWLGGGSGGGEAEEILRARYARGEIDEEAYRRMRDELRHGPGA